MAFVSSVVGLSLSILFAFVSRLFVGNVRHRIEQWNLELDERVELVTAEQIAGKQLEQLACDGRAVALLKLPSAHGAALALTLATSQ